MSKFNYFTYDSQKRIEKLNRGEQQDLLFDLINAFALTRTPTDSALLLQDLLTEKEIRNLAKRLRIAKLILQGYTHQEILKKLHCSYATITKVRAWLETAGDGLKKVVQKLPKQRKLPYLKKMPGVGYGLPQIVNYYLTYYLKSKEKKMLTKMLEEMMSKSSLNREIKESMK